MKQKSYIPIILMIAVCFATTAFAQPPKPGDTLPPLTMAAFAVEEDASAIGLKTNAPFTIADINTPYIMIEIIGVYCSICHEQSPSLTRLFKRLKKTKLDKKITMLGIAAGGTAMEVKYIREQEYIFPVTPDPEFEIYTALSEPKTPFTMIIDKKGKVLYSHRGIIPDINEFYKEIKELVK